MYFAGSLACKRRGTFNMHIADIYGFMLNFSTIHGIFCMHIEYMGRQ
jgi:hypothetical protein